MHKALRSSRRVGIGIAGGIVVMVGIAAIPLPGPGWLIVFAGLGILATEFTWAQNLLGFAKQKYERWQKWLIGQSILVKIPVIAATALVVVVMLWLGGCYGLLNYWLHLHQDWLRSPLPFFGNK